MKMTDQISRRNALKSAMGVFLPLAGFSGRQGYAQEQEVGTLGAPDLAGPGLPRTTDWDNDPYIISIEVGLRCMCGCNLSVYQCRTTDFTCAVSPATHRRLISMVEGGMEAQEIIDIFIAENGEEVLMAPTREGFNLTAYFLPGFVIAAAGSALAWTLVRKQRAAALSPLKAGWDGEDGSAPRQLDPEAEVAIRREMQKLDL